MGTWINMGNGGDGKDRKGRTTQEAWDGHGKVKKVGKIKGKAGSYDMGYGEVPSQKDRSWNIRE